MILKASQRAGAKALGAHLLKDENEHVEVHEVRGFCAEDVIGAFKDPKALKEAIQSCWAISDSRQSFETALEAKGLFLARGDRRAHVAVTYVCPFGLKARWLLRHKGYEVEDHLLTSRAEQDAFKAQHDVKTTPQTFIGGERVGGYDDLRHFFDLRVKDPKATSYTPVVAVFGVAAAITLAINWLTGASLLGLVGAERFIATAMCLLAMLKLQDVDRFATMFLGYDLLARRYVPYAYFYPFAEFGTGALMLAGVATWLSAPVALVIGGIGAISVFKAVYIDKRELKCACVGGSSNVPLGFVSMTENVMMVAMAIAMGVTLL